ncbi:endonuclease/exonuclease/phosphatase family protein [Devosia sp.]|uniref:endonuclease/exonuclease/phosphatase family protein n=1 Tax=Devosia sp. TaxID=1871048 RepID=UPI003A910943
MRELRGGLTALMLVALGLLALAGYDIGLPGQDVLQTLRFHIAALLFGMIVVMFAFGAWRRGLLFTLALAVGFAQGAQIVYQQQEPRRALAASSDATAPLLRMMSFNVLTSNTRNAAAIAAYIRQSGADLVLLLEATPMRDELEGLADLYPHVAGCSGLHSCGTVLLSKTRLERETLRALSPLYEERLLVTATTIAGQRINIVGAHLSKPYFDTIADGEANNLANAIARLEGPLVLAGDFNAAAWSDNIARLLRRTELIPGPSYPGTWPVELGPLALPIDNIFTRPPLLIQQYRAIDDPLGSNHRGLIADIVLTGGS